MFEQEQDTLPRGLVRIHRVITRAVDVARERSHAYANGHESADSPEVMGFVDYVRTLANVLHGHHTAEDEIAFPALRDRFGEAPWDLLAQEHRAVVPILAEIEDDAARIGRQASPETFASLAGRLDRLAGLWGPHHEREEKQFAASIVAERVPADEQAAIAGRMAAHSEKHTGPAHLVVPFLLYNLEADERRAMSAFFPPVVTEQLVPSVWLDKWSPMKPFLLG